MLTTEKLAEAPALSRIKLLPNYGQVPTPGIGASLKSRVKPSFKNLAMLLFLTLIVSAAAFEKAVLKSGLKSTAAQLKLFRKWSENEHKKFGAKENAFRFVFTDFS